MTDADMIKINLAEAITLKSGLKALLTKTLNESVPIEELSGLYNCISSLSQLEHIWVLKLYELGAIRL